MSEPKGGPTAYPNLENAIGTSVPVVTTVLAAIGTATYVVPLQDDTASNAPKIDPLQLSYPQLAVILGIFATGCFVVATLAAIHAHASAFDALPPNRQTEMLASTTAEDEQLLVKDYYRAETRRRYEQARTIWIVGLGLLALTTGALAHKLVEAMVPISALAGIVVGIVTLRDENGWISKLSGVTLLVASLAFGATFLL